MPALLVWERIMVCMEAAIGPVCPTEFVVCQVQCFKGNVYAPLDWTLWPVSATPHLPKDFDTCTFWPLKAVGFVISASHTFVIFQIYYFLKVFSMLSFEIGLDTPSMNFIFSCSSKEELCRKRFKYFSEKICCDADLLNTFVFVFGSLFSL